MNTQTNSHILASFVMYDRYGKYKMIMKPFNNEDHMNNYILCMQRSGAKFVSTKILINESI
jgi:hypothetical protein